MSSRNDDRYTATTLSSVLSYLLRNDDVSNDISRRDDVKESIDGQTNNDESRDTDETDRNPSPGLSLSSRNPAEETADDSWLRQASEGKARSRPPSNGTDLVLSEDKAPRALPRVANAIREDEDDGQESWTRPIYPMPTTMRGVPLAALTSSSQTVMRGFYVTRSENDLPMASSTALTLSTTIPANDSTVPPSPGVARSLFDRSTEQQGTTETAILTTISPSGNGQHETTIRSPGAPDDYANSIVNDVNDETVDNLKEDFSPILNWTDSQDSDRGENFSGIEIADTILTGPKREKSLDNFDSDNFDGTAPPRNAHVTWSTTPTKMAALAASEYNKATTPLRKRVYVVRKRVEHTRSPIEEAVRRRAETDVGSTASGTHFENGLAPIPSETTLSMSTTRKLATMATTIATPAIASESTTAVFEASNEVEDSMENPEKRTTTEATTSRSVTEPIETSLSISELTSADDATINVVSTTPIASIITTTVSSSVVRVAEVTSAAITSDPVIATTPSAIAIETTADAVANYSATPITLPITAKMNSVASNERDNSSTTAVRPTAANLIEVVSAIANYPVITVDPTIHEESYDRFTTDPATLVTTLETTTANYPALAVPRTTTDATTTIVTDSSGNLVTDTTRASATIPATTLADTNVDVTTSTIATTTVTYSAVTDPTTTTDPNVITVTAIADTLTEVNSEPPVWTSADATLDASLITIPDNVSPSSTESSTISESSSFSTTLDFSGPDTGGDGTTGPAESRNHELATTMFESSPTLASPVTTISQSPANTDPETSTMTATTAVPTFQTSPILPSIPTTTIPSTITSDTLDSVEMTDERVTSSEANVERELEQVNATIAQHRPDDRESANVNETNSSPTAKTNARLDTKDYSFGREAKSRRRVLNRTNNWAGSSVAQQRQSTTDRESRPRVRVTVHRRHRGRSRERSFADEPVSSAKVIDENHKGRSSVSRRRPEKTNSETISSDRLTEKRRMRVVHDPAKNVTRKMRVVLKRIRKKMDKTDATVSPVQSSSSGNKSSLQPRRENVENDSSNSSNANPLDRSRSNRRRLRGDEETLISKRDKVATRLVLKSIGPKSEKRNKIEQSASADSSLRNDSSSNESYAGGNLIPGEGNARKRVRVVLKSVRRKERNVTTDEASANFGFHSEDTLLTQDDPSFRVASENLGVEGKKPKRRRTRVVVRRVKPKFKRGKTTVEKINATDDSNLDEGLDNVTWSDHRETVNFSLPRGTKQETSVVSRNVVSETNSSTEETSERHLLDEEESGREQTGVASDKMELLKFAEKDSIAEETNADVNFAVQKPRITFPLFNLSNNFYVSEKNLSRVYEYPSNNNDFRILDDELSSTGHTRKGVESNYKNDEGMTIEQSEGFDTELHTESIARIEKNTDRLSLEVDSSKNGGSTASRSTGNGYPNNRHRRPTQSTVTNLPIETLADIHRRGTVTTVSPMTDLVDAFEGTESYSKLQTAAEDDQKTDVSDQSVRALEFAVTVADPPSSSTDIGRTPLRDAIRRKISTTVAPRTKSTTGRTVSRDRGLGNRQKPARTKNRPTVNATTRPRRPPVIDYDYYEDEVPIIVGKSALNSKLFLTSSGTIRCLDQGNFPHPYSCKKFISCARMVNGQVIGTEYTCPDKLSFDPVGGICNWSAGLGCKD